MMVPSWPGTISRTLKSFGGTPYLKPCHQRVLLRG